MAKIPLFKALYLICFFNGSKDSADSSLFNGLIIYQDKRKLKQFWITEINAVKFCYYGHKWINELTNERMNEWNGPGLLSQLRVKHFDHFARALPKKPSVIKKKNKW